MEKEAKQGSLTDFELSVAELRRQDLGNQDISHLLQVPHHHVKIAVNRLIGLGEIKRMIRTPEQAREFRAQLKTLRTQNLTAQEIADLLHVSQEDVEQHIRVLREQGEIDKTFFHKYEINEAFFHEWSPALSYFCGLFASDGNMMKTDRGQRAISIGLKNDPGERELLEKLAQIIGVTVRIGPNDRSNVGRCVLPITRKAVYERMEELGFTPNKTSTLEFPSIPEALQSHFVRGFFDGDGCVRIDKDLKYFKLRTKIAVASKNFMEALQEVLEKQVGLSQVSLSLTKPGETYLTLYALHYGYLDSVKLYQYMYQDDQGLYLSRKKAIFEDNILSDEEILAIPVDRKCEHLYRSIIASLNPNIAQLRDQMFFPETKQDENLRIPDDTIIQATVLFIKETGRLPTMEDIQTKHSARVGSAHLLPSYNLIKQRFGGIQGLIIRVNQLYPLPHHLCNKVSLGKKE